MLQNAASLKSSIAVSSVKPLGRILKGVDGMMLDVSGITLRVQLKVLIGAINKRFAALFIRPCIFWCAISCGFWKIIAKKVLHRFCPLCVQRHIRRDSISVEIPRIGKRTGGSIFCLIPTRKSVISVCWISRFSNLAVFCDFLRFRCSAGNAIQVKGDGLVEIVNWLVDFRA